VAVRRDVNTDPVAQEAGEDRSYNKESMKSNEEMKATILLLVEVEGRTLPEFRKPRS
jgi:hypothetical protein